MKTKSVKSLNPCKSVIQTIYEIVKAQGGELSVGTPAEKMEAKEARPPARPDHSGGDDPVGRGEGSVVTIALPLT
jgi:hypothetical protein